MHNLKNMQDRYFKEKKVLITGINGFVGSHLARRLKTLGAKVYGISRSKEDKDIFRINVFDFSGVDKLMKSMKINICYHLAGESLVESGQKDPYNTFKLNIGGALSILESARKNKLEKVIIASTVHVYGDNKLPYLEEYSPKPSRPYETSKACADLIAQSYAESFNIPVLIPRFANIYGPGDLNFTRLIPRTMKAVLSGVSPQMWGGKALREYLFIDDAVDGYIELAKIELSSLIGNRIFNFGSGNKISVKDLIKKIIKLSGRSLGIEKIDYERRLEIHSQYVSYYKAKKLLGWEPKIMLDEGLKRTLAWYGEYFANNFVEKHG